MQTVKPLSSPALIRPLLHVCFEPIKGHGQELLRGIPTLRAQEGEIKDTLRCDLSPGRVAVQGNSFVQGGLKTPFPHTKAEGPVFAPQTGSDFFPNRKRELLPTFEIEW